MNLRVVYVALLIMMGLLTNCTKDTAVPAGYGNELFLSTDTATAVSQSTATMGMIVSGGSFNEVIDKGLCYAPEINPIISNSNKISDGAGAGAFTTNVSGLIPGTTYYIRCYATTNYETIYGDQKQFTTLNYQLCTIISSAVTSISYTAALSGGNITSAGGGIVSARGVCWNTASTPTVSNNKTNDGAGAGMFTSDISGLIPGTTYYLRAYAVNQAGTAYGNELQFTAEKIGLATVGAASTASITKNTAICTGSVTANGGGALTSKGFCWGTTANPTVASNSSTNNGTATGSFTATLTGLVTGTTYYVRAYAINAAGTAYGVQTSFKTL